MYQWYSLTLSPFFNFRKKSPTRGIVLSPPLRFWKNDHKGGGITLVNTTDIFLKQLFKHLIKKKQKWRLTYKSVLLFCVICVQIILEKIFETFFIYMPYMYSFPVSNRITGVWSVHVRAKTEFSYKKCLKCFF